ncbi:methyltransferase [Legionella norrlandica]|uniref:Histone-lysine N-methyltransferase, H3 lysine-79 specific n=1 Tax=Legionella norrlandica TaxID=1498499 RepID=A0A0A2T4I9_9GAMM|nr:methyltransferase [Legionella norrlandica]KGP62338.1 methyltransferase [Legionella norrlandica]
MANAVLDLAFSKTGFLCLLLLVIIFLLNVQKARKKIHIKQWQKSLNLTHHAQVFEQLYFDTNGFLLSQRARENKDAIDYVYGEIEFLPFIALLSLTHIDSNTVFYDLGSGTGKAVIACGMVYPVRKSVGIELFPELHQKACEQLKKLATIEGYIEQSRKISFILGDFLTVDLSEATLLFINSTTLFGPTWEKLSARLDELPHLKTVITTSKALLPGHFKLISRTRVQMSWGVVFAFIHVRKN